MILSTPQQLFQALAHGQSVQWAETGSDDWTPLDGHAELLFKDLFTGFIQFKAEDLPVFNVPVESEVYARQARYFVEFVKNLHGFEVYRVGKYPCSYYAVRFNHHAYKKLEVFRIAQDGKLHRFDLSTAKPSLADGIERARAAVRRKARNQVLEDTGLFASLSYQDWKRNNRRMGAR